MKIVINGKDSDLKDGLTVNQLLIDQDVRMPEMVSVELNGQVLKRSAFETTTLKDDDKVEFLYFMGGGNVIN